MQCIDIVMKMYIHYLPLLSATVLQRDLFLAYKKIKEIDCHTNVINSRRLLPEIPAHLCPTRRIGETNLLTPSLLTARIYDLLTHFLEHLALSTGGDTLDINQGASGETATPLPDIPQPDLEARNSISVNSEEEQKLKVIVDAWGAVDAHREHIVREMDRMGLPLEKFVFAFFYSEFGKHPLPGTIHKTFGDFVKGIFQGARSKPIWLEVMRQNEFARIADILVNIREEQITSPWFTTLALPHQTFGNLTPNALGCFMQKYTHCKRTNPFPGYTDNKASPDYVNYKLSSHAAQEHYSSQYWHLLVPKPSARGKQPRTKTSISAYKRRLDTPRMGPATRVPVSSDDEDMHVPEHPDSEGEERDNYTDWRPPYLDAPFPLHNGEVEERFHVLLPIDPELVPEEGSALAETAAPPIAISPSWAALLIEQATEEGKTARLPRHHTQQLTPNLPALHYHPDPTPATAPHILVHATPDIPQEPSNDGFSELPLLEDGTFGLDILNNVVEAVGALSVDEDENGVIHYTLSPSPPQTNAPQELSYPASSSEQAQGPPPGQSHLPRPPTPLSPSIQTASSPAQPVPTSGLSYEHSFVPSYMQDSQGDLVVYRPNIPLHPMHHRTERLRMFFTTNMAFEHVNEEMDPPSPLPAIITYTSVESRCQLTETLIAEKVAIVQERLPPTTTLLSLSQHHDPVDTLMPLDVSEYAAAYLTEAQMDLSLQCRIPLAPLRTEAVAAFAWYITEVATMPNTFDAYQVAAMTFMVGLILPQAAPAGRSSVATLRQSISP